jgi:hypothetical protein
MHQYDTETDRTYELPNGWSQREYTLVNFDDPETKGMLKEELSISNDIKNESEKVYSDIERRLKKQYFKNGFIFDEIIFGTKYEIFCYIHRLTMNEFREESKHWSFLAELNQTSKQIKFHAVYIDNILKIELLKPSIFHELTHIYQLYRSKKDSLFSPKFREMYGSINQDINDDILIKYAEQIILTMNNPELSANLHQLYSELLTVSDNSITTWNNLKRIYSLSAVAKIIKSTTMMIDYIASHKEEADILYKKKYSQNARWFISQSRKFIKTYKQKSMRVLACAYNVITFSHERNPNVYF